MAGVAEDELGDELQFCCSESLTIPMILAGGEEAVEADVADFCASVVVAMGKLRTVETSEVMNYQKVKGRCRCRFNESPLCYEYLTA